MTTQRVLRARKFILEDENGELRALLCIGKGGPGLYLYDEKGKLRAMLRVGKYGPRLSLSDEKGKPIWTAP